MANAIPLGKNLTVSVDRDRDDFDSGFIVRLQPRPGIRLEDNDEKVIAGIVEASFDGTVYVAHSAPARHNPGFIDIPITINGCGLRTEETLEVIHVMEDAFWYVSKLMGSDESLMLNVAAEKVARLRKLALEIGEKKFGKEVVPAEKWSAEEKLEREGSEFAAKSKIMHVFQDLPDDKMTTLMTTTMNKLRLWSAKTIDTSAPFSDMKKTLRLHLGNEIATAYKEAGLLGKNTVEEKIAQLGVIVRDYFVEKVQEIKRLGP